MSENRSFDHAVILPTGTQVVVLKEVRGTNGAVIHPKGAVGVIVKSPVDNRHAYIVRFLDGFELAMKRKEFAIRKHYQRSGLESRTALDEYNLHDFVIYRCVVGSRAFGLASRDSDTDRRGIFLPPAELQWSIFGVPDQIESPETEECYWELQRFLTLALKANPNVLECLYTPMVERATPLARKLLEMRSAFLSRLVYQTYNGYVASQFKKLSQDLRNKGAIKWKHAMHLIRLLLSGITVLREGFVPVHVDQHRGRLLSIRDGKTKWDDVNKWRLELHKEFDAAFAETKLPEQPDYERVNAFLIKARREMVRVGAK